ncbi:hybrid sensor histidine kinase/response regulator [Robbsia sp. KACC 23696]|uniref:hybrid sensor histidine kinase/response regulator n=1 Tax=Robbsia sp. KACC 23696 TaxID=3149231 RepID=UPI00325AFC28
MTSAVKILMVDDVGQNLVALDALLRRDEVLPLHAADGAEALELLLEHDIALALIDVQMPGMDGFELAEFMRGSPRTRHVPIIFLTATDRDTKRVFKGYEAGAVDFLYKPFDPHILSSKVDVFVQLHQQKRQLASQLDAMKQLVRTNDMFVAVLGHDLRNPLSSVMMNAEIVRRTVENAGKGEGAASTETALADKSARLHKAADRILTSGQRMAQMIDQLLGVARVRSGQLQIAPERFDLHAVARAIADEFQTVEHPPTLRVEARGDTHGVWDRGSLAQIISNLVGNALRHGDALHPVSIEVDGTQREEVRLRVSNGGEIPAAIQPHLFTPFRSGSDCLETPTEANSDDAHQREPLREGDHSGAAQPDDSKNQTHATAAVVEGDRSLTSIGQSAGLGLGLFIVHELVRLHAGSIDARSLAGSGTTTFEVALPRQSEWRRLHDTGTAIDGQASAFAIAGPR